jgi:hypothetical protein
MPTQTIQEYNIDGITEIVSYKPYYIRREIHRFQVGDCVSLGVYGINSIDGSCKVDSNVPVSRFLQILEKLENPSTTYIITDTRFKQFYHHHNPIFFEGKFAHDEFARYDIVAIDDPLISVQNVYSFYLKKSNSLEMQQNQQVSKWRDILNFHRSRILKQ